MNATLSWVRSLPAAVSVGAMLFLVPSMSRDEQPKSLLRPQTVVFAWFVSYQHAEKIHARSRVWMGEQAETNETNGRMVLPSLRRAVSDTANAPESGHQRGKLRAMDSVSAIGFPDIGICWRQLELRASRPVQHGGHDAGRWVF